MKEWFVNGLYLGLSKGLEQEIIDRLKFVGCFCEVNVFSSEDMPKGTLELREYGRVIAIIEGLKCS